MPTNTKEYAKKYYNENKEKILARMKQVMTCEECGHQYTISTQNKHLKTKKHLKIVEAKKKKQDELAALKEQIKNEILNEMKALETKQTDQNTIKPENNVCAQP